MESHTWFQSAQVPLVAWELPLLDMGALVSVGVDATKIVGG